MSDKKTIVYWAIQIGVWAILSSALFLGYWKGGNRLDLTFWQALIDFIVYFILAIIFSHLMKIFILRYCSLDNLKWIDILKIFGLVLVSATFFYLAYNLHIQLAYRYLYNRVDVLSHPSQSALYQILFFINITVYYIFWVICYVAIKGIMKLNKRSEDFLKLESSLKEAQLNTLKGQINPHFMFNSLNNIKGLMLEDVDRSREMLTRLSEILRYSLTKSSTDMISLEDELEMVDNFVNISKIQFEDRLDYSQNIDPQLMSKPIPPMIIQLLIENAVKHGISKLKQGGKILLEITSEIDHILIKVTNSGKLTIDQNSTKVGLDNIQKRLDLLYGSKASFSLSELHDDVIAQIKIPQ